MQSDAAASVVVGAAGLAEVHPAVRVRVVALHVDFACIHEDHVDYSIDSKSFSSTKTLLTREGPFGAKSHLYGIRVAADVRLAEQRIVDGVGEQGSGAAEEQKQTGNGDEEPGRLCREWMPMVGAVATHCGRHFLCLGGGKGECT